MPLTENIAHVPYRSLPLGPELIEDAGHPAAAKLALHVVVHAEHRLKSLEQIGSQRRNEHRIGRAHGLRPAPIRASSSASKL